jgi:hypothetical protein
MSSLCGLSEPTFPQEDIQDLAMRMLDEVAKGFELTHVIVTNLGETTTSEATV